MKILYSVLCVFVLSAVVNLGFAVQPKSGEWELEGTGRFDNRYNAEIYMRFSISDDRSFIHNVVGVVYIWDYPGYPGKQSWQFFSSGTAKTEIVNSRFSYIFDSSVIKSDITCVFDSDTTAHGTWMYAQVLNPFDFFNKQTVKAEGDCKAIYMGSGSPVIPNSKRTTTWGKIKNGD